MIDFIGLQNIIYRYEYIMYLPKICYLKRGFQIESFYFKDYIILHVFMKDFFKSILKNSMKF